MNKVKEIKVGKNHQFNLYSDRVVISRTKEKANNWTKTDKILDLLN